MTRKLRIVRFSNGRFGIRKWSLDPLLLLFEWCPYRFLHKWAVQTMLLNEHDMRRIVEGRGWGSKSFLDTDDTYETELQARQALDTYQQNLRIAAEKLARITFDCGTPV